MQEWNCRTVLIPVLLKHHWITMRQAGKIRITSKPYIGNTFSVPWKLFNGRETCRAWWWFKNKFVMKINTGVCFSLSPFISLFTTFSRNIFVFRFISILSHSSVSVFYFFFLYIKSVVYFSEPTRNKPSSQIGSLFISDLMIYKTLFHVIYYYYSGLLLLNNFQIW